MAGATPQNATTLLSSSVTIAANGSHSIEFDSGQCYFFELWADLSTNASATDGVEAKVKRKTGAGGNASVNGMGMSWDVNESALKYLGLHSPGTVEISFENKDGTYDATLTQVYARVAS